MHGQSFPRSVRLLSASDYKAVFDGAPIKVSAKHAMILARPSQLDHSRLGLIVAKKQIRLAVRRNRVKRLVREYFRVHPLSVACDLVVLARAPADRIDNEQLRSLLDQLWQKLERQLASS